MDETAVQLERDPAEMETSDSVKLEDASERVKVRVAVSPALREATSEVRAMVGGVVSAAVVSTVSVRELLSSSPSVLVLPAESEKASGATEITALVVLLVLGVKVALSTVLERAVQLEREPPETATSDSTKSVEGSESEKVSVAVSPVFSD